MKGVGWMTRWRSLSMSFLSFSFFAAASFSRLVRVREKISSSIRFRSKLLLKLSDKGLFSLFCDSEGRATPIGRYKLGCPCGELISPCNCLSVCISWSAAGEKPTCATVCFDFFPFLASLLALDCSLAATFSVGYRCKDTAT